MAIGGDRLTFGTAERSCKTRVARWSSISRVAALA